jgi:transposase
METPSPPRKPYPTDVSDEEWAFVTPYLTLMTPDAPQRRYDLREVFNGLRFIVRGGLQWRLMPHDLPPWPVVSQQTRRWLAAGVFAAIVHDVRVLLRLGAGRAPQPTAAILDSRTLQSTPESGARAGYDGAKRKKGSKIHAAVDTLGDLLALHATPADAQDRDQVARLAQAMQEATGGTVEVGFVDQGYTGDDPAAAAARHGIRLEVVKLPQAKRGFVLRRAAGSSSAPSPGPGASAVWPVITSDCRPRWRDSTLGPLPYSRSTPTSRSLQCCDEVHNRL